MSMLAVGLAIDPAESVNPFPRLRAPLFRESAFVIRSGFVRIVVPPEPFCVTLYSVTAGFGVKYCADVPVKAIVPVPAKSPKTAQGPDPALRGKFGAGVGTYRACLDGDDSPDGTVTDGFRKVVTPLPMGLSCHWEKVE